MGQKRRCFVFMADGKDSAVPLMKNVVNRMSQQRTYFQETIVSFRQRLSHSALCTGLSATTERQRKGERKTPKVQTSPLLSISRDVILVLTILPNYARTVEHFLTFTL